MQKTGKSQTAQGVHIAPGPFASCCWNPFRIDLRSLGCFRIAIALVLLYDVLARLWDLTAFYLPGGAISAEIVRQSYQGTWSWSLNLWFDSTGWQLLLWGIRLVAAGALLVGFRSRWSAAIAWLLTVSLHTATPLMVTGGDVLLAMMLFWSILLPVGSRLSMDARRASGQARAEWICSWATVGVILQLMVMYWYTGIAKCNATWFSGDALELALADGAMTRGFGRLLLLSPGLLKLSSWFTLVIEFGCPLLILWPGSSRWPRTIGLLSLVALHVGIELSMNVLIFSFTALAALVVLTPGDWWRWLERSDPGDRQTGQVGRVPHWESFMSVSCLSLVLLYNVLMLAFSAPLPGWVRLVARVTNAAHWDQRWDMFRDPEQLNYRFVMRGRLANGQTIDLARGDPLPTDGEPSRPAIPMEFATSRRVLLFRELARPNYIVFRPQVGKWLAERWNAEHAEDDRLLELEVFLFVGSGRQGPVQAQLLSYFDTRASGNYRLGKREGLWVMRDDKGGKTARGRYRGGLEEGSWIYWDGKGNRTMAGEFQQGLDAQGQITSLEHGEWTYYFSDGSERHVRYEHGRVIEEPR
jgi:hypothetical protein